MKYSIAFKDLPFEPEEKQVIYVENQFDERINAIIKDNYESLKWHFKRANLDFVYLPMFFNDEEIKEKVLYYAPYLTSEVMEKAELRSSYLLGYMSHPENKEKIAPSLLYAPKKEDDEWIFQGQAIELDKDDRVSINQWFDDVISDIEEETTPTRRYDEDIDETCSQRINESPSKSQVEYSSTPTSLWDKIFKKAKKFGEDAIKEEDDTCESTAKKTESSLDDILDEGANETLEELEKNIQRLRLMGIPLSILVEFVAKYETISRLRITDDLRIFLPEYGNKEVMMPALHKAVYLLFLFHPEGIILQHLEEHHSEFANYYRQTMGKEQLSPRNIDTINNLEYPGNTSLYTILSKIKLYFRNAVDEHLARHYYIVGKPGEPYNIANKNVIIEWEDDYD